MTEACKHDFLCIDFETTGSAKENENIPWQMGAIRFAAGDIRPNEAFSFFINVPQNHRFNPYAPGRWASMREQLAKAPHFQALWPQLQPWLTGRALVAHHAPTERAVLAAHFPFQHFGPWVDTLNLTRIAYPYLNSYKLEDIIPTLHLAGDVARLAPNLEPHDAFYDACAAAVLLRHILAIPSWKGVTLEQLAAV